MDLPDLKKLKDLLKLLRAQGVLQYQSTDLNLVLSEHSPSENTIRKSKIEEIMESDEEELTPEQEAERLLFYSATPPETASE
jgi:hypothetical protein